MSNHRIYPLFLSHGSIACSRISWSVLGSTLFSCRSSEARLSASAYSARILVLIGIRADGEGVARGRRSRRLHSVNKLPFHIRVYRERRRLNPLR